MLRHEQKLGELLSGLSTLNTDWKVGFAKKVISAYQYLEPTSE